MSQDRPQTAESPQEAATGDDNLRANRTNTRHDNPGQTEARSILPAALYWHYAGCAVLRARADGSKAPGVGREWQKHQRPTEQQLRRWFADGHPSIGLVTGSPSGQLELLELEGRAAAELPRLLDLAVRAGIGPLWAAVLTGYSERTPSGGYHWLYRIADHETPGNTRLAQRAARPDELTAQERAILERHPTRRFTRCLAETRGEGGWVIVAPSHGPTHPTGLPYRRVAGSPRTIPTITWEQREQLHAAIRQLDEPVTPVRTQPQRTPPRAIVSCPTGVRGAVSPGDDFEARTDWSEVLEPLGWRLSHADGQTRYWTRPGKDRGVSATTGHAGDRDRLFVFSSSTELPSETPLTKFAAYAWLHHGGGFSAAARALRADGYGGSDTNNINDHRSARGSNR